MACCPQFERAAHLIGSYIEGSSIEMGITQAEALVLTQVGRLGPTPIATLHHEFGHKRSTLTNVLDRLEQRDLVRREPNPHDRRSLLIHLTRAGHEVAHNVIRAFDALEEALRASVTERDLRGVDAVVNALAVIVRQHDRDPPSPSTGSSIR